MRIPHSSTRLETLRLPNIPFYYNCTWSWPYRRKQDVCDLSRSSGVFLSDADYDLRMLLILEFFTLASNYRPSFANETSPCRNSQCVRDDVKPCIKENDFASTELFLI